MNADRYTPTGPDQIPTGEIAPVEGTPLDFRQMMPIGARLHSAFQQMVYAHGYDHNFVLNKGPGDGVTFAARAYDPRTGRIIDCFTTEPGVQVYTSNGMNGSVVGSSGTTYRQTEGFTLETQHFPDSPNKPNFPTTELKPGQEFRLDDNIPLRDRRVPTATPTLRAGRSGGGLDELVDDPQALGRRVLREARPGAARQFADIDVAVPVDGDAVRRGELAGSEAGMHLAEPGQHLALGRYGC